VFGLKRVRSGLSSRNRCRGFPYGFAKETHEKYPTVLDLFHSIIETIQQKDFDVALIAAAGLSIPIASTIKNMGKVAISLGGHLQIFLVSSANGGATGIIGRKNTLMSIG
jgi:hypothetical protein